MRHTSNPKNLNLIFYSFTFIIDKIQNREKNEMKISHKINQFNFVNINYSNKNKYLILKCIKYFIQLTNKNILIFEY
jgi:hypothetical protein